MRRWCSDGWSALPVMVPLLDDELAPTPLGATNKLGRPMPFPLAPVPTGVTTVSVVSGFGRGDNDEDASANVVEDDEAETCADRAAREGTTRLSRWASCVEC